MYIYRFSGNVKVSCILVLLFEKHYNCDKFSDAILVLVPNQETQVLLFSSINIWHFQCEVEVQRQRSSRRNRKYS